MKKKSVQKIHKKKIYPKKCAKDTHTKKIYPKKCAKDTKKKEKKKSEKRKKSEIGNWEKGNWEKIKLYVSLTAKFDLRDAVVHSSEVQSPVVDDFLGGSAGMPHGAYDVEVDSAASSGKNTDVEMNNTFNWSVE